MKYSLNIVKENSNPFYTEIVLKQLIKTNGHKIIGNEDAQIILVSLCDITEIIFLEKIRNKYPNKKICVGGAVSYYYKTLSIFADYVCVGQGFEFFKCHTINEIEKLSCIYSKNDDKIPLPSRLIEWDVVPIGQVSKKVFYYWGSVGCKNRCGFCMTSNVQPYQKNGEDNINSAMAKIKKIGGVCNIVTNDSGNINTNRTTQSIMLKDFLKINSKKGKLYRIGLEFAKEQTRKKYKKYFTDDELIIAINKSVKEKSRLRLFCISGVETFEDWDLLLSKINDIYERGWIVFKFTNVVFEPFTEISSLRFNIDINNYFNNQKVMELIKNHKYRIYPLRSLFCANPIKNYYKSALNYTFTFDEYNKLKTFNKNNDLDGLMAYCKNDIFNNSYNDNYFKIIKNRKYE
jgi:hypothetical protein